MEYLKKPEVFSKCRDKDIVSQRVSTIIRRIQEGGMNELKRISKEIDNYSGPLMISRDAIRAAADKLPSDLKRSIILSIENIRSFHRNQMNIFSEIDDEPVSGLRRGMRFLPVNTSGCYIPGGRYPLPSTVLMNVIPAQEAGVKNIIISSPPSGDDCIDPVILATASLAGIDNIFAIGGAQAIAAMTFGTGDIPKCDMITGPGNVYVTEAKRQLYGQVGIDSLAGPSEVMIVADEQADSYCLAMDLMAQAEHEPLAKAVLFTTDRDLGLSAIEDVDKICQTAPTGNIMRQSWDNYGTVIFGKQEEGISFANEMAPEHLQICMTNARELLMRFESYGAAFLGYSTPVPYGDYIAGTNHVLPTGGSARFSSGLWTGSFMKALTSLEISGPVKNKLTDAGINFAEEEGLWAHGKSLQLRKGKDNSC